MKLITVLVAVFACVTATTLKCEFTRNTVFKYVCQINNVELVGSADGITFEEGQHQKDKSNEDVKMVSFVKSSVNVVPSQLFAIFPSLEILDLSDVKMIKWNRDFLKNAKNLKRVWLAQNELREVADNSFLGATSLENLVLHSNKITKISDKAFNGLSHLKSLELQQNLLTTLSGSFFAPLKKLNELNLSENQIAKIDEKIFAYNTKLEFLNLNNNNITDLPKNTFKTLQNLTVVYLQNNQITKLSKELFTGCATMMEMRLDNNLIKELPMGIFTNNKKFKLLNLMNNPIESFDGKILPEGMELLYLDETTTTKNIPEKLEVFQGETPKGAHWKGPEAQQEFTTADK